MRLDELRELVAASFKEVNKKEDIENLAKINAKLEECATEQKKLEEENKELLNSYKEVVLHTSVKPSTNIDTGTPAPKEVNFETMLNDFMNKAEN